VVEVFEAGRDVTVFVTGPIYQEDRPKLEEFFKLPGKEPFEQNVGSGIVIHPSGYVITNAHGVERVVSPVVVLSDGQKHPAELVASSSTEDVALLKIEAGRRLSAARLGASGDVMIGETVIVIGHPHGLMHTCTTGILSAVGRTTSLSDRNNLTLQGLIQTDAAINPGSSGGPWFNVVGEVMGMTVSKKGGADNISFAIPIATIRKLLPGMLDVERRYGLMTGLTLAEAGPCRVAAVQPGSPAERAGVQLGDVITQVVDLPISDAVDCQFALVDRKPGETLDLDLMRQEEPVHITMTLEQRPKPDAVALASRKLGLGVAPLEPSRPGKMLLRVAQGILVTAVEPSLYENVEHRPAAGDVLARINKIRPRDLDHLGLLLDKLQPGDQVTMVLVRHVNNTATRVDIKLALPR
jgi:serine protease Do